VERQDWMRVWNETARVLERSPGNPQALAYQALVRLAMGQGQVAVEMLSKALAADPNLMDGYVYLALAYTRMGQPKQAEATVARASKRFPERAEDFRRFLAEVKRTETSAAQASAVGGAGGEDPHASLRTPGEKAASGGRPLERSAAMASEGTRPPAGAGRRIAGTVDIDPSLRSSVRGGVLFVFARESGASGGPPVAVKRLAPVFPAAFELSEADSMMGQPFPETLLIEARLDEDGDPTTRPPTDPKARADKIKVGQTNIRLVLKRD
jgi:hypothetical protein